jgi:hypothetical protein
MDKNYYNNPSTLHISTAPTGLLGEYDMQVQFDTQFINTKPFSIQGNREFDTYANALTYATTHSSAFPGIILTVSDNVEDSTKNGVYLVSHDKVDPVSNPNGLKLIKLTAAETGPGNLGWGEIVEIEGGGGKIEILDFEIKDIPPSIS